MRRLAVVLVLLGAVPALRGQTRPAPLATGTAIISGRVFAVGTRAPVRNAHIELEQDGRVISSALTDGEGRFGLVQLPAGLYRLTAAKPGYVKSRFGESRESRAVQRLQIRDGAAMGNLELQLSKAGAIAGRLLDDAGDPIIGATVTADRAGDGDRTLGTTETDDLGEYRIGGLPDGRFIVGVRLSPVLTRLREAVVGGEAAQLHSDAFSAFIRAASARLSSNSLTSYFYYPGVADRASALALELVSGEERTAIDFNLPAPWSGAGVNRKELPDAAGRRSDTSTTAEIRGRILQADGRPLARAQVRLEPVDASGIGAATLSDDDGVFQLAAQRAGEYLLSASKRGYLDAEYGQTRAFARGQAVRLAPGDKRERVDLVLPRAGSISGRIVDENGDPIEGARVQVLRSRFEAGQLHLAEVETASRLTDDLGRYRVHGLPPGAYAVRAALGQSEGAHERLTVPMAAIAGYAPTYYPGTSKAAEARWIAVGVSEDVREAELAMVRLPTARISGHAFTSSGDTVKGGLILKPSRRSGAADPTPLRPSRLWAPDGFFEFSNVPPGEYVLQAAMGRSHMWAEGEFAAQYLTVNGADMDDLVIRTVPGSTITGRVTFEGGEPPNASEIGVSPIPVDPDLSPAFGVEPLGLGPPARAEVHPDWTFEIVGISGPRRLRLAYPPAGWALKSIDVDGSDITDAVLMFGTPDQSLQDVHVVLMNQTTAVEGIVTDDRGRPMHDCLVVAFATDRDRRSYPSRFMDHSVCQRDGSFVIRRLPAEEYFVAAIPLGSNQGPEDWHDPRVLEAIARRAMRLMLAEGQKIAMTLRVIVP